MAPTLRYPPMQTGTTSMQARAHLLLHHLIREGGPVGEDVLQQPPPDAPAAREVGPHRAQAAFDCVRPLLPHADASCLPFSRTAQAQGNPAGLRHARGSPPHPDQPYPWPHLSGEAKSLEMMGTTSRVYSASDRVSPICNSSRAQHSTRQQGTCTLQRKSWAGSLPGRDHEAGDTGTARDFGPPAALSSTAKP